MKLKYFITMSLLLISNLSWSHSELEESIPHDGATINSNLDEVVLVFKQPVKLVKFELIGSDNESVETLFEPSLENQAKFVIEVNGLEDDHYTVLWTIMGGDGHKVEGEFQFTLQQTE